MRVMAKITIPVESGSRAVKDGSIGKLIQTAAEHWKPEAMYFGTFEGKRTAFVVFDLAGPSLLRVPGLQGGGDAPGGDVVDVAGDADLRGEQG